MLAAIPFDDEADAVALANATDYGLVAGVWTADGGRQIRMAKRIKVGQVFINAYGAGGGVELPFGGVKQFAATAARRASSRSRSSAC